MCVMYRGCVRAFCMKGVCVSCVYEYDVCRGIPSGVLCVYKVCEYVSCIMGVYVFFV